MNTKYSGFLAFREAHTKTAFRLHFIQVRMVYHKNKQENN